MNKIFAALTITAAAAIAAPAAFAQSVPTRDGGWFVNGQAGYVDLDHDWTGPLNTHDNGYQLSGGYRWSLGSTALLGVEAGYNDLGNIDVGNAFSSDDVVTNGQPALHGFTLGANGRYGFARDWYVSARAGVYRWKAKGVSGPVNPVVNDLDKTSWYTGAGIGYDFTHSFSVGLNVDHYDAEKDQFDFSSNLYSVGAEYRF